MRNGKGQGFTYASLVMLIAVMSLAAACAFKAGALLQRRAAEAALLEVGAAFSEALNSYAEATPRGQSRTPRTLQELVRDPRYPMPRRHLRKVFIDPLTGNDQWGLVELDTGPGIVGVYSLSNARPIKVGNFDLARSEFAGKQRYRDWIFAAEQARAQVAALYANGKLSSPLDRLGDDDAGADKPDAPREGDDNRFVSPMQR